jgi:FtsH-binding integral membrane protein
MLLTLIQYLPAVLLGTGLLLGGGSLALRLFRKDKLSPRVRGQVFFWGAVGFWSMVIASFMVLEKFL